MTKWLRNFWEDESGITATECGIVVALVVAVVIGVISTLDSGPMETPGAVEYGAE